MPGKYYQKFNREITINDLYPELSPEEQLEAEYRLLRYLEVVKDIFEQIAEENPEILTELERRAMLRKKESDSLNSP